MKILAKVWDKLKKFGKWLKKDKKRLIAAAVILVVGVFLVVNGIKNKNTAVTYQTSTVQKGTIVSTVSASGRALTAGILNINTQASGVVKKVYVKDGQTVYAGQKIADITLDSTGQQAYSQSLASFLSAKNSVASANTSYYTLQAASFAANQKFINDAVARTLSTTDPTYIQEYDAWKAAEANFLAQGTQVSSANASLGSAAINLQQNSPTIVSPFSGFIGNVGLVEGMIIGGNSTSGSTTTANSQKVATIENEATPIIQVTLSEIDVPKVKVGQKATVTFDSISDKTYTGVVATVDRIGTISSNVTSYTVNIKLDTKSTDILPNMAATADIIIATKVDTLIIPTSALTTQNGQNAAKTLKNGVEVDVPVETGISSDTETEIVSGLNEGETVITGTVANNTSSTTTRSVFSTGGFGGAIRTGGR
jgi:membrane fusion protein, macrolide-specific efflux system